MKIILNNGTITLNGIAAANLITQTSPQKPFAVVVNTWFIVKGAYARTVLNENSKAGIARPVADGQAALLYVYPRY